MEGKKKSKNWTDVEANALVDHVVEVGGEENVRWDEAVLLVQGVAGFQWSEHQVRTKWRDLKSLTKKKEVKNRESLKMTGGGPCKTKPLSEMEQKVLSVLPSCVIDGIEGGADTFLVHGSSSKFSNIKPGTVGSSSSLIHYTVHGSSSKFSNIKPGTVGSSSSLIHNTVHGSSSKFSNIKPGTVGSSSSLIHNTDNSDNSEETQHSSEDEENLKPSKKKRVGKQKRSCKCSEDLFDLEVQKLETAKRRNELLSDISSKLDDIICMKREKLNILKEQHVLEQEVSFRSILN